MSKLWPWSVQSSAQTGSAGSRFLADSSGNIAMLTAYMAPFIFAIGALAIDMGQWQQTATNLHGAIDKAAYSALIAGTNGGDGFSTAQAVMAQIGFPCSAAGTVRNGSMTCTGADGYSLTVNNPPKSGSHTSSSGAWEVTATAPTNLYFARWFLPKAPTVEARAVSNSDLSVCILALDNNSDHIHSIFASQSADVHIDCAAWDNLANSKSGDTVDVKTLGNLHFKDLGMVAGYACDPSCEGTLTVDNPIQYNKPPVADPYAKRVMPSVSSNTKCDGGWMYDTAKNNRPYLDPGVYCDGLTINRSVTLRPGVYIVDTGDLTITNGAVVTGTGVTFILTSRDGASSTGNLKVLNGAQLNITAPTGPVDGMDVGGIAVWQNAGAQNPSGEGYRDPNHFIFSGSEHALKNPGLPDTTGLNFIASGSSTKIDGVLYFPSQAVVYNGGTTNGTKACTQIVAFQILFNGAASFNYPSHCPQLGVTTISANGGGQTGIVE